MDEEDYFGFTDTEVEALMFLQEVLHNRGFAVLILHPRDLYGVSPTEAEIRLELLSYFVLKYGSKATRALAHLEIEENDDEQD